MAAEIDEQEAQQENEQGSKKKLVILIASGVLILIIGVVGTFLFLGGDPVNEQTTAGAQADDVPLGNAYYVSLPRPFIFNAPGQTRDRLVQINVQLMVRGTRNEDLARQNIPAIEGTLHRTFSSTTAESLLTSDGRTQLREGSLNVLRNEMTELTGSPVIEEILFTGFVIQ